MRIGVAPHGTTRLAQRPLGAGALGLVALEAALALAGERQRALAALILLLAPGLALVPLLPARVRRSPVATLAAAPALGFAALSAALITVARVGIDLDGVSVRVTVAAIVLAGLLALRGPEVSGAWRWGEALGLLGAVALGVVLENRVLGGRPAPGNDWAKYVLYGDEIRRQGSLLIDNPFWLLGVPFREDPGVPSLYGAYLALTGAPAAVLAHGIWAFAVMGIASVFALVRAFWGAAAGVLAAALYAALPINQNILGWHGLANVAALALLALVLLYATALVVDGLRTSEALGLGLALVGLAAAHRLSFGIGVLALAGAAVVALAGRARRRAAARGLLVAAGAALVLGAGVASDLIARQRTFGGTQPYSAYASSKLDLGLLADDLTWPFVVAAGIAVALLLVRLRRERALGPLLGLLAVTAALAYGWLVHLPLSYLRMAYYLPLSLVPLAAIALTRWRRPAFARAGAALGLALVAVIAVGYAWDRAAGVRRFYAFADAASLRGLDAVAAELRPNEVVVTDRCWSFLATWLLHTRTLAALEPGDIQPQAELPLARQAQAVLGGTPAGLRRARALGVRFLIVDPTCLDGRGRPLRPPVVGEPRYVSRRLAVLELTPGRRERR